MPAPSRLFPARIAEGGRRSAPFPLPFRDALRPKGTRIFSIRLRGRRASCYYYVNNPPMVKNDGSE